MKKLIPYLGVALSFLLARFFVIYTLTEVDTGFIMRGSEMWELGFNGALALVMGLAYMASRRVTFDGQAGEKSVLCVGKWGAIPLFLAAVGMGVCAGLSLVARFRFSATLGLLGIVGIMILVLVAPVTMTGKQPRGKGDGVMMLFVVCFALNGAMCIFLANTTISRVPQNYFSLLSGLLFIVALFYEAKLRAGMIDVGKYFRLTLLTAMFLTITEVPTVICYLAGAMTPRLSLTTPVDIAMVAFIPYFWCNLLAVLKNSNQVPVTKVVELPAEPQGEPSVEE